jgi:hypothetical protein
MSSPSAPDPDSLRHAITSLGDWPRKVVIGVVVLMMKEPQKIRDREWLLELYTHVAAQALEMGDERLGELQDLVREQRDEILNLCFQLFLRVAEDARQAGGTPTLAQASVMAMAYFSEGPSPEFEPDFSKRAADQDQDAPDGRTGYGLQ